jgi:patatin-like phospholipase/acyl hydrolase
VDLYLKNGGAIFDSPLWKEVESLGGIVDEKYRAAPLEKLLQQYLGDLRLSQLVKPCLVTSYDIVRRAAKLFNSADIAEEGAAREFHLRDVARATSAAPTYFEPAHIRAFDRKEFTLVDGGVFANNPAMCACVEAFKLRPELGVTDLRVMSLGTGSADKPYKYEEAKNWGKLQWALPVLNILMSGVAETVDFQLRILFKAAQCPGQYLRVEANLNKFDDVDSAMDNASPVNMEALKQIGNTLAEDNEKALTEWAKTLMEAS